MLLVCRNWRRAVVQEPVADAFEVDDVGVVADPVNHHRSDGQVAEDAAPTGEGQVPGHDQRRVFAARGDELEEEVRGVLVEGNMADLVNDQQAVTPQRGQCYSKDGLHSFLDNVPPEK